MEVYGTAPSHFTRKVRVVLEELGLKYDFKLVTDLLSDKPAAFASNPLLQIPVLVDQGRHYFDSSLICQYLLETYGSERSSVRYFADADKNMQLRQRLVIIHGGMEAGVRIMRCRRSEIPELQKFSIYQQDLATIRDSLQWLEQDLPSKQGYGHFSVVEITLQCLLDWVQFRQFVPTLAEYPKLKAFNDYHQGRPSFVRTHPAQAI